MDDMNVRPTIIAEQRPGCAVAIERASTPKMVMSHIFFFTFFFWHRPAPEVNVAGNGNKATIKSQTALDILLL